MHHAFGRGTHDGTAQRADSCAYRATREANHAAGHRAGRRRATHTGVALVLARGAGVARCGEIRFSVGIVLAIHGRLLLSGRTARLLAPGLARGVPPACPLLESGPR